MVKLLNENTVIVSSKELGTFCWLVQRFIPGKRCPRVMRCNYPVKKDCQAVQAEIEHLNKRKQEVCARIDAQIQQLYRDQSSR